MDIKGEFSANSKWYIVEDCSGDFEAMGDSQVFPPEKNKCWKETLKYMQYFLIKHKSYCFNITYCTTHIDEMPRFSTSKTVTISSGAAVFCPLCANCTSSSCLRGIIRLKTNLLANVFGQNQYRTITTGLETYLYIKLNFIALNSSIAYHTHTNWQVLKP